MARRRVNQRGLRASFPHSLALGALAVGAWGGGSLAVSGCEAAPRGPTCGVGVPYSGGECWPERTIFVNSTGYMADRVKVGVSRVGGRFELISSSGDVVLEGKTSEQVRSPDTEEDLYLLDFSSFREQGTYHLRLEDGSQSPDFTIGPSGAEDALERVMLGLYGLRCGVEVEIKVTNSAGQELRFQHEACHLEEARLATTGDSTQDDTGGWHDAGDYGKYTVNGAFAVAFLLKAHEHYPDFVEGFEVSIPERGGKVPDILDEARVELEWLLKVQLPDGSFAHKVTALNFEGTVMPENDGSTRYFSPAGTAATGSAVGALALAARLFRDLDPKFAQRCFSAAQRGYAYLEERPTLVAPDLSAFTTGSYLAQDGDQDERLWAAIELFEASGQAKYLAVFEANLEMPRVQAYFDWYTSANLAFDTYLRSQRPGRSAEVLERVASAVTASAGTIVERASSDPYGRGSSNYSWGSNGAVARMSFVLGMAYYLDPKSELLDAAQSQLDYIFGRNPFGRSFVTGVGYYPAAEPHHRPSRADSVGPPWPGLLVGGPHSGGQTPDVALPALKWQDFAEDYNHNEVAINWNTALAYNLAMVLGAPGSSNDPCAPLDVGAGGAGAGDADGGCMAPPGFGGALLGGQGGEVTGDD